MNTSLSLTKYLLSLNLAIIIFVNFAVFVLDYVVSDRPHTTGRLQLSAVRHADSPLWSGPTFGNRSAALGGNFAEQQSDRILAN